MWVDIDGVLIREEEAVISIFDHGFLYGVGCFETFRTYNRHPFLFHEHIQRLKQGLMMYGIDTQGINDEDLKMRINNLLDRNEMEDSYIRLSVSAGIAPLGLPRTSYDQPRMIIICKPLSEALLKGEILPKQLRISPIARNTPEGEHRPKSFQFGNNVIASQQMKLGNTEEGLFLTNDGMLAEGLVSNLFFVKNNVVYTPSLETGILNGITRRFVIKLIQKLGLTLMEGSYPLEELRGASEIFVTNSVQELVPVTSVVSVWEESSRHYPILNKLLHHYRMYTQHLLSIDEFEREH